MKPKQFLINLLSLLIMSVTSLPGLAQIRVVDDTGELIALAKPAKNVISLSPGLTELVYAAGGSAYLKGVVSFSDYPQAARQLPRIGSYNALDMEKILLLQPDLVLAWKDGNPKHQVQKLKKLGLTVYTAEPLEFSDIPKTLNNLGQLMATESQANKSIQDFNKQFKLLEQSLKAKIVSPQPRTFIQIWNNPVMTVNQAHLISKVISFCGGSNIFATSQGLTHTPTMEVILEQDPEIIIATGMAEQSEKWLQRWQQWPFLSAVKNHRLYAVNPNHLVRHTPRILLGIREVCEIIHN